jgi:hypothetical protein
LPYRSRGTDRLQSQYELSYRRGVWASTQWGKPGKRGSRQGHDIGDPQVPGPSANKTNIIAFGQESGLVVWQRIILPNGSSIVIDNLPATDPDGYAGLGDEVDLHT